MTAPMVYGLGSGFVYACSTENATYEVNLPKLLSTVDPESHFLISTVDMAFKPAKVIQQTVGRDRLMLDSGGYTLWKEQQKLGLESPEFGKRCEKMKTKFLKLLKRIPVYQCFELDNEYFRVDEDLMSTRNYLRQEVFETVGFYPTPVFKLHLGIEYWMKLCESDLYPTLAIGGLANTRGWGEHRDLLATMMKYARECGKRVHLLGCQNVDTFRQVRPDTVDFSIFQFAINLEAAKQEHPELTEYKDLKKHIVLNALARAKSRSFLYNDIVSEED